MGPFYTKQCILRHADGPLRPNKAPLDHQIPPRPSRTAQVNLRLTMCPRSGRQGAFTDRLRARPMEVLLEQKRSPPHGLARPAKSNLSSNTGPSLVRLFPSMQRVLSGQLRLHTGQQVAISGKHEAFPDLWNDLLGLFRPIQGPHRLTTGPLRAGKGPFDPLTPTDCSQADERPL